MKKILASLALAALLTGCASVAKDPRIPLETKNPLEAIMFCQELGQITFNIVQGRKMKREMADPNKVIADIRADKDMTPGEKSQVIAMIENAFKIDVNKVEPQEAGEAVMDSCVDFNIKE